MHADTKAMLELIPEARRHIAIRCRADVMRMADALILAISKHDFNLANTTAWRIERRIHAAIIEAQQEELHERRADGLHA